MRWHAVVVALVIATGGCGDDDTAADGRSDQAERASGRPAEVAAIVDGKVVILDAADGGVVRTLAEGADAEGATALDVSADGELVYFTRSDPVAVCEQGPARQIVSVPVEGGPVMIVASGASPVLSPDGEWLAYATGGPDQCRPPTMIAIQELDADGFRQELIEGGGESVEPLAWSPDSRRLLYTAGPMGGGEPEVYEVEPSEGASSRRVPLPPGAYLPTYLGDAQSLAVVQDVGGSAQVVEVDTATGEVGRALFESPGRPAFRSLATDRTGRHLVFTTLAVTTGGDELGRWSEGGAPVVLAESTSASVEDAVWVPV